MVPEQLTSIFRSVAPHDLQLFSPVAAQEFVGVRQCPELNETAQSLVRSSLKPKPIEARRMRFVMSTAVAWRRPFGIREGRK